ncbi:hypothetical protein QK290_17910 [Pseudarthrobacter sp. AL07]|uniref:hypothetical protein n=1 Tax=Pseudarthrobacter sp. AL07 TaxID=3042233 RepID=UPI00249B4D8E|nr:hypothetical protein [Pseudarthrobacter sp. AL07]MDI3210331.1 hypothetical protein [Pseudarthrobacter sp. AL07]
MAEEGSVSLECLEGVFMGSRISARVPGRRAATVVAAAALTVLVLAGCAALQRGTAVAAVAGLT